MIYKLQIWKRQKSSIAGKRRKKQTIFSSSAKRIRVWNGGSAPSTCKADMAASQTLGSNFWWFHKSQAVMKAHSRLQSEDVMAQRANVWFVCWKLATRLRGLATQTRQHWMNCRFVEAANLLRQDRWSPKTKDERPTWCCPSCPAKFMVSPKAIWTCAALIGNESIPKNRKNSRRCWKKQRHSYQEKCFGCPKLANTQRRLRWP